MRKFLALLLGAVYAFNGFGVNEPDYYLEWVGHAGSAAAYMDTGYVFKTLPRIEIGMTLSDCSDTDIAGNSSRAKYYICLDMKDNGQSFEYVGFGGDKNVSKVSGVTVASLHTYPTFNDVIWGTNFYYNGTLVAQANNYEFSDTATDTFKLFKSRNNANCTMRVSYMRMYDNDVLVRSFRPAWKSNAPGFYDSVNDVFYACEGGGAFTYGDKIAGTDALTVAGDPANLGSVSPAYGVTDGFAAGDTCTATASGKSYVYDGNLYQCTGWELYTVDGSGKVASAPYLTGSGTTCSYTHPDPAVHTKLVWKWTSIGEAVTSVKAGSWDDTTTWSSGAVPTSSTHVFISGYDVYCSGDVSAASIEVASGSTLRFHADASEGPDGMKPAYMDSNSYSFNVTGDVILSGGNLALHGAKEPTTITSLNISIGGDLRLEGAAKFGVAAATTAATDVSLTNLYNLATVVNIGGEFYVGDTAIVYPYCDMVVGCAVKFQCGSFYLGESAQICAQERGWYWYTKWISTRDAREEAGSWSAPSRSNYTFARGAGMDTGDIGAGYGGAGSNVGESSGKAYGFKYAPFLPGSPGGGDSNYGSSYNNTSGCGRGGGVFWLTTSGTATINGTIYAHALTTSWRSASGGSVWIAADDYSIGGTATINAYGGGAGSSTPNSIGGGGRISLAQDVTAEQLAALARGEEPQGLSYSDSVSLIACNVSAGTPLANSNPTTAAGDGTATFVCKADAFVTVSVTSYDNGPAALGLSPSYGDIQVKPGTLNTFTAPVYGTDPADSSLRYQCLGFVISNATGVVTNGSELSVSLTVNEPITVAWRWGETEYASYPTAVGGGSFTVNGTAISGGTVYLKASESNSITAVPDEGCEFLYWLGQVSDAERENPTLTLDATEQIHLTAAFRTTAAQGTFIWNADASGDFLAGYNWQGGVAPGKQDTVVVGSGECRLPVYVKIAALQITGGTVKAAQTAATDGYIDNTLKVTDDVTLSGSGRLELGATDGSSQMYNTLDVGGNLVLNGTSSLLVAAGRREGEYTWATGSGFVKVAGNFRLNDSSVYSPNCDGYYGGGVLATVGGAFIVGAEASVNADGLGNGVYTSLGWKTGVGDNVSFSPSHGGYGIKPDVDWGYRREPYDYLYAPMMPGQQNRESNTGSDMVRGGGNVRVVARSIRINGTVSADGVACNGGNSSGGTIWLVATKKVSVGANASLSAKGAYDAEVNASGANASGGGRISLCSYMSAAQLAELTASPDAIPSGITDITETFVSGCSALANAVAPGSAATSISDCWGTCKVLTGPEETSGFAIIVR